MDSSLEFACRAEEIPRKRCRLVSIDDTEIAVWHLADGEFRAINNVCPHQHFSKLHEGTLDGTFLTCPMHGWTFDLDDGKERTGNGRATVYPLVIDGGDLYLRLR